MFVIHAFIRFCMVLNPTMCQELEIAPADHAITSQPECMRGLMMGSNAEFDMEGVRFQIAGGSCKVVWVPNEVQTWLHDKQDKDSFKDAEKF